VVDDSNAERQCNKSALLRTGRSPSPLASLTVDTYLPVEAAQDRSFTHRRKLANTVLAPKRASLSRNAETYCTGPKCCVDAERGARSLPKVSKSRRLRL
jgi:hypothetical protein